MDLVKGEGAPLVPKEVDLPETPKEMGVTNPTLTIVELKKLKSGKVEFAEELEKVNFILEDFTTVV